MHGFGCAIDTLYSLHFLTFRFQLTILLPIVNISQHMASDANVVILCTVSIVIVAVIFARNVFASFDHCLLIQRTMRWFLWSQLLKTLSIHKQI